MRSNLRRAAILLLSLLLVGAAAKISVSAGAPSALKAGVFKSPVAYDKYVDESFAKAAHPATMGL